MEFLLTHQSELNDLEIGDTSELWPFIRELLNEISPKDYKGTTPPQKSYEKGITESELWAFNWWSSKCAKQMYIKFVLKNITFHYMKAVRQNKRM